MVMKSRSLIPTLFFSIGFIILPSLQAGAEEAQRLSLSERMVGLETKVDEGFKSVNQRIDAVNQRIDDLKSELKSDIADLRGLIYVESSRIKMP